MVKNKMVPLGYQGQVPVKISLILGKRLLQFLRKKASEPNLRNVLTKMAMVFSMLLFVETGSTFQKQTVMMGMHR